MVAPANASVNAFADPVLEARDGPFPEPPCPLTPELRSDLAYRRAAGYAWVALAATLHYDPDALRRAAENDPEFAAAQEKAWAQAAWEGEADAMRRLRRMLYEDDPDKSFKAAEVLVKYAREHRRDDTRIAVEQMRTDVQKAKIESKIALAAEASRLAEPAPYQPCVYPVPTEAEYAEMRETAAIEGSTKPGSPHVYLWGGRHDIGRSVAPDESDLKVRVIEDWSAGCGARGVIYWVIPETLRERCANTDIYFASENEPPPWIKN